VCSKHHQTAMRPTIGLRQKQSSASGNAGECLATIWMVRAGPAARSPSPGPTLRTNAVSAGALRRHHGDSEGRRLVPPFGDLQGGLARHRGGRVNLTERQRGRQREPAEPAVSVARTAAALRPGRSSGLSFENSLPVGAIATAWTHERGPNLQRPPAMTTLTFAFALRSTNAGNSFGC
jgi:hypothetical protein